MNLDFKEIGVTAGISLVTSIAVCFVFHYVIAPMLKKDGKKTDKDGKKS